ncbi:selenium metabolism-associated LysR family transcriptional regulator [Fusibacter sp. 3D3]|uniref:selenium metabolism-associated LysR family transcriptional regulator n=1 Tax=Fusibacter sp. 3D3 TaxID=1048380 RepID=UPI000852A31B|nr:selenium metabolism-associated LysR family transcriptional regulator [Fusibacter sp. 3D3]GAU79669.1 transcriptional regulator, LysR family [Fusibacter sp. 3D3]
MNTAYLRTYIEVVNLKSFSKAAEKLFISQPAVTKQIKSLEKDFGIVLLKRSYNDIIPTKEGKEIYKYATTILNKEEEIFAKMVQNENSISGELTICSSTLPANYLLDEILLDFSTEYKNITYNIKKMDSSKVYDAVESGNISFGFTGIHVKKKNIESIEIAKDQLVLAVPAHKFNHLDTMEVSLEFLLEQDILIRGTGSATLKTFEEAMKLEHYAIKDFKIKAIVEDNEIIKKMILKGIGVSIISRLSIDKEVNEGSIMPLTIKGINLTRGIYYIYHKNKYFSNIDEKFKNLVLEKFNGNTSEVYR